MTERRDKFVGQITENQDGRKLLTEDLKGQILVLLKESACVMVSGSLRPGATICL